jgi:hypothetical protein
MYLGTTGHTAGELFRLMPAGRVPSARREPTDEMSCA